MSDTEKRTIGEVLKGLGRITDEDIEAALAHQREHGGYFGEALVASGVLSEEELEFGLASQFDLPYLFPEADAVDLEAVALVSPEWALENLTLPILRAEGTLKVVVDSPLRHGPLEELAELSGLDVEVGLASPATIRDLVRRVYARAAALDQASGDPLSLENVLDGVRDAGAARWGISVRGSRAQAWWDEHGSMRRRPLAGDWTGALERLVRPPPSERVEETRSEWIADVGDGETRQSATVHCIVDESGREYVFVPRTAASLEERFPPPPQEIVSEIGIRAQAGTARFVVTTEPQTLGHEILPHLPELTLDPSWRSIYLNASDQPAASRSFSLKLPEDPSAWEDEIEALEVFHFDAVAVDLSGSDTSWAGSVLDIAAVAFLLWPEDDVEAARESGARWRLIIREDDDQGLEWTLESLETTERSHGAD